MTDVRAHDDGPAALPRAGLVIETDIAGPEGNGRCLDRRFGRGMIPACRQISAIGIPSAP